MNVERPPKGTFDPSYFSCFDVYKDSGNPVVYLKPGLFSSHDEIVEQLGLLAGELKRRFPLMGPSSPTLWSPGLEKVREILGSYGLPRCEPKKGS